MYVQYVGFNAESGFRTYNFEVLNPKETRQFSVLVRTEAFLPSRLRVQDGPSICFERLKRELEAETEGSRTEAHLSIGERDIQEYLERHHAPSAARKKAPEKTR
jgi:hypothetical protein